mgnify:CR=1 FL=1|tara:strand:+ start:358 stop:828 length:471 start_codon:yes stop_codon:yes gene_type:complete
MAYTKLQASSSRAVVPSDTINIPSITSTQESSTATSTSASELIDTAQDFVAMGVKQGWTIVNTTDGTIATVVSVDGTDTMTISADIMASAEAYTIYSDKERGGCVLYVGVGGILKVETASGDIITFQGVPTGSFFPVQVVKVYATTTTATDIVALW